MTATQPTAAVHSTTNFHLYGAPPVTPKFVKRETPPVDVPFGGGYGYVSVGDGGADFTVFISTRDQAERLAAAFWALSTQFPPTPDKPAADQAHECGTPAAGELDASDYPVPMTVIQRDPADPESWVYRCAEGHPSSVAGLSDSHGWQSCDYASEDDALTAAAEHARAMHDGGLPNELAERAAAAERAMAPGGWSVPEPTRKLLRETAE